MTESRIQFNNIVQNQLPAYVREEFPLISEFLKQYYISQEFQGAPNDLIQNIDNYIKLDNITNVTESVILGSDISFDDETISVDLIQSPTGTNGFPDSYGLLKIDDEIITYTGKTESSFTGCIRGFSGISSYFNDLTPDVLVFESTASEEHIEGSQIQNLSILFLKEFLLKVKFQILPGLEDRELSDELNQNIFIKQSKDFYLSKGTDRSFEILFKSLYNEDVKIIRPSDYLLTPSNAHYIITNDLVVEGIEGDPTNLEQSTLYQDQYTNTIGKAYAPITSVEKIVTGLGKTFYKLSIDAGYNRDISVNGAIYGSFSVHPKTKVIGEVSVGSTVLNVDSTVGFSSSGELTVTYQDQTVGVVSYTSKSITQFFDCSNITSTILDSSEVGINTYAYGRSFLNQDDIIKVRINSVLSGVNYSENNNFYREGDTARIKTLGIFDDSFKSKSWFYNTSPIYKVKDIQLVDSSDNTYQVNLNVENYFKIGDSVTLVGNDNVPRIGNIVNINSSTSFLIKGQGSLPLNYTYTAQRNLSKALSNTFPGVSIYQTNIQNIYSDNENLLVASSSLPSYSSQPIDATDRSVTFSGTFVGEDFQITSTKDHGFYTGDAIYYYPEKINNPILDPETGELIENIIVNSSLFDEGLYFVKRVNSSTIKLAKSRTNIFNSTFVNVSEETSVNNNKIQPYNLRFKTLESQKLLRQINPPTDEGGTFETEPGFTGILVNGVEIKNYKSNDVVYYGKINDIEVLSPGSGYDIIDPPTLHIDDSVGTGATGYVSVSGSLLEIRLLDSGFDYEETPIVSITGGNGSGAKASVNMKLITHSISFNSEDTSDDISLGASGSVIGFGTYHKFRNAEQVIYITNYQQGVGGITTNSSYFVSVQSPTTVKLHTKQEDAISGINTVVLSSYGNGKHFLQSYNKKSVIDSINVISSGSNYQNKKRTTNPSGINTSNNIITILDHDYNSGEILKYTSEGTPIQGLNSGSEYYVTKVDDNRFQLSNIGIGSTSKDFYYNTKQYVDLKSVGVGTHSFNYQDISVSVIGKVGISSIGTETFEAQIQPIFRGEVTSVHLSNNGVGYGSSEIINFDRQPQITLINGNNSQLLPIINDGQITEVLVLNSGSQYISTPNLRIIGDGVGAVVTPVLSNNRLTSVKVISGGIGYTQNNTSIIVSSSGEGAEFKGNIQTWRINLFQREFSAENFTADDGYITIGESENFGLQYSHIYAPRKLRELVFGVDQSGQVLYGRKDLRKVNSIEVPSTDHSPIIGWSYDGNPIYGPYGYTTNEGAAVTQMKSGYIEESSIKENRPSLNSFPPGFFVEDYTHYEVSDQTVLDKNNGRFCVTPEFPNGTYAYFATINNSSVDSSGVFLGNKRPVFPYLIGNYYRSSPITFNFEASSNQDLYDLNQSDWIRNTNSYNLIEEDLEYKYVSIPNNLSQTFDVTAVAPGSIQNIGINTGGYDYQVGDSLVFDNTNTRGFQASVNVSRVLGKEVNNISFASSTITNVEIYPSTIKGEYIIFSEQPHNFKDQDIVTVSGLSTTSSKIEGSYNVGITTNKLVLTGSGTTSSGIGSDGVTGIITYINVTGDISYPNVRENDIFEIDNEKVKILNVDQELSRLRVIRSVNGTIGSAHSIGTGIFEDHRKLSINAGFNTSYNSKVNREIYFNPLESVGLGTSSGVGIGTTITFSNPGAGATQIFIPTKTIYIKNHNLETGDQVTYSTNGGSGIVVLENGAGAGTTLVDQQNLFVAKIDNSLIGLATVRVGLGTTGTFVGIASTYRDSTTLFFSGIGTGIYHSFTTNYSPITGEITRNTVTVSTAQTHGLNDNDSVYIDVNPSITTSIVVKYNDYNRKVLINPKDFVSSGVNTENNSITIQNHGFKTGQKVIHTTSGTSYGILNDGIYYVVRVDNNTIKLSNNYYESTLLKPNVVGITSSFDGTISLINPPISVFKNSNVIFDVSDSSLSYLNQGTRYPAFELNFYIDNEFTQKWDKSQESQFFNVRRVGKSGISSTSTVTLFVNDNIPKTLYYKLDKLSESNIPVEKEQVSTDLEVISGSEIQVNESLYNGKQIISISSTSEFTYTTDKTPESSSYSSSISSIKYETDSQNAYGSISKFEIKNPGRNYYSIPGISTVITNFGTGAILEANSNSIGKIKSIKINDIGYNFPSDATLRPTTQLPQIIKIDPLTSIESIGIASVGRGYVTAPKLLVFDGKTNEIVSDIDLKYSLGDSQVTILKNTFGINNTTPTILPVDNSNGVGISTVGFNTVTKDVTVTLSVGFSTAESFPFEVNDKVLIENISVGIGSTARGYNSENYNYKLFTLTSVDENRGGIGSVTYNLSEFFSNTDTPGAFDPITSSGRIIPEKFFPIFDVKLKLNDYLVGEVVKSNTSTGIVESWDENVEILKISSKDSFIEGEIIEGLSSNTQGVASSIRTFDSSFNLSSSSRVEKGWETNSGFLNDNLQRIQDSFYYQNFSYSLRSRVPYETWDDVVSTLNHTIGFRKFSDYQLESNLDQQDSNSMVVGISTDLTSFEIVSDLIGQADLNCVYDFDLVRENSLNINSRVVSDEILFSNRILTDYFESVGNRVLSIDDISGEFNSNPRPTAFSVVEVFDLEDVRAQKYVTLVTDRRFTAQRQIMLVDLIHDNSFGYINQYGRVESTYDLGSFDFVISGSQGQLLFYPTNYTVNDYYITSLSYNIDDNVLGVGSTTIGDVALINTSSVSVSSGTTATIVGIASTYRSLKVLLEISSDINNNEFELNELNIVHDGTEVELLEYGQLTTTPSTFGSSGFGTYSSYIDGSQLKVDFHPSAGVGTTAVINTIQIALNNESYSGVGTINLKHAKLESRTTSIASSVSPTETVIGSYPGEYDSAYYVVQVSDTTNNRYQMSEVIVLDDYISSLGTGEIYDTEYGNIETVSGLGTIGSRLSGTGIGSVSTSELLFTPLPNIDVQVKVYMNAIRHQDDDRTNPGIDFNNASIVTEFGTYDGTERDIKRAFNLTHKNDEIFEREFDGSDSSIVSISENTIRLPNHFFVSGENITYVHSGAGSTQAIGIGTTSFPGIGTTDKLPSSLYVVKINDDKIKLASTAENALKIVPDTLSFTSVGIGTSHRFISTNQNAKVIVAIDNIIQSPVVSTAVTTTLSDQVLTTDDIIFFSGITSFFGGDLIRVGDEIMRIDGVGIGSTNAIRVRRPWLGTSLAGYSTGDTVRKVVGNYNIVDNILNFTEAPYGNTPIGTSTNAPDDRDWVGISTGSSFQGRTFLRSGVKNTTNETYYKNYILDDISAEFNSYKKVFDLKSNQNDVTGIATENAIILINDIFQGPGLSDDYNLSESAGITSITFTGTASSVSSDVNVSSLPIGGVIVSVGSTEGFGYQPLVSAGGTATVSGLGTIQSISIGNSGSGYRSGIQVVNVGVQTFSTGPANIEFIGTASVSGGHVVSVAITNPGSGYTSTNPPTVVFDDPLSYSDIPLIYSSSSISGVGSNATVDIVVGQGSSVIDFEIKNTGFGYGIGETLTVSIGGTVGIPTSSGFSEFQLTIDQVFTDEFTGWTIGELQVLDNIEKYFDGETISFPLSVSGDLVSIRSSRGSKINVQDVLLVFLNNILQVPGEGYTFNGGSIITFTEAPKIGDVAKILFYKGSGDIDVVFRSIIETVKEGDQLTIQNDLSLGQESYLREDPRTVTLVKSIDLVDTNPYFGPGNVEDENLERPVLWCRQTEDKIINEKEIGKDRELYEPVINPFAYIINSVGVGSTEIYVDNLRPFFDAQNENDTSLLFQKEVTFISQNVKVGAIGTAVVSTAGTISTISITDGGQGYTSIPTINIQNPIGFGSTATATASITAGIVTSISIIGPGTGYTTSNPPVVLISPPTSTVETNDVSNYYGDSGIIVGFGTTTVSSINKLILDLHIPLDSYLRQTSLVGTAVTLSSIDVGDYFIVYGSNVGSASTTIYSRDLNDNIIGIGSEFIDNVYQVDTVSDVEYEVVGVGTTTLRRVYARITGISTFTFSSTFLTFDSGVYTFDISGIGTSYTGIITTSYNFGNFSWGKILLSGRSGTNEFSFYGNNGVTGITTSSILKRFSPLKYTNYIV